MTPFQKDYWERNELNSRREPTHPVIKAFAQSRIQAITQYVSINSSQQILEVGAGNGFFSYYWDRVAQLTATDYSSKMIGLNPVRHKKVMDATNLRFPDNSFDIVFESCLLHHVQDVSEVISEMTRVSQKYLIFLEPNRNNLLNLIFGAIVREERQALKFSLSYLKKMCSKNHLTIVAAFSYGVIAPNKLPEFMLPVFRVFDRKLPLIGLNNIIICEK